MTDFDPQALQEQLELLMERLAQPDIPRSAHGYQGPVKPGRVTLACVFVGADGLEYVEDPTEFAAAGDLFLRQYVTLGRKSGASIGDVLAKLLPLVEGGVASAVAGPAGGIAVDALQALFARRS